MTKPDELKKAAVGASELLAAAAAIAAGTHVYADVINYINPEPGEPGHFDWALSSDILNANAWLDITRSSADQDDAIGPSSVGQLLYGNGTPESFTEWNRTAGGALVAADYGYGFAAYGRFTVSLPAGASIDGQLYFPDSYGPYGPLPEVHASGTWSNYGGGAYYSGSSNFAPGEASYMGVRFSDVGGYHYGWIGVVRGVEDEMGGGLHFDAFAWAYETEPGVPIIAGIPAPGTLAALAFGVVVIRRGRTRKDD